MLAGSQRSAQRADDLAGSEDESCVDWYFEGVYLASQAAKSSEPAGLADAVNQAYRENLENLLGAAQHFGRLDLSGDLHVQGSVVPVRRHGFVWGAEDFQRFVPPPLDLPPLLHCRHTRNGCGVPLVVQRCRQSDDPLERRFFPRESSFAATAVLRFADRDDRASAVLELHDPLRVASISAQKCELPLASDLTAPLAVSLQDIPRTYLAGFVQPGDQADQARLHFLEPYQPGKAPVILIHGLFSDPHSWADLTNDLRAIPGFCERFQIWLFRYPTGQGFLRSAATLRTELATAVELCDPEGTDPAMRQMVLIGHSMGGLLAKLQVTHSRDAIWRRLSKAPLEEIVADQKTRARLGAACFFEPAPHVRRVVFIATPHCGSTQASGLMGNLASRLVEDSPQDAADHEQLLANNPGVFADTIQKRLPTSVDLLRPDSPVLAAMREMEVSEEVALHNIIGISKQISLSGPSDGVVPVASAEHPNCASELTVTAKHAAIHRTREAAREIARILIEHLTTAN